MFPRETPAIVPPPNPDRRPCILGVVDTPSGSRDWRPAAPTSTPLRPVADSSDERPADWEAGALENLAAVEDALKRAKAEWEELRDSVTKTNGKLETLRRERDHATTAETEVRRSMDDLLSEVARKRTDLEEARADVIGLEARLKAAEESRAQLEQSRADVAAAQGELANSQKTADELRTGRDAAKADHDALRNDHDELRQSLEAARRELAVSREQVAELEAAAASIQADGAVALERDAASVELQAAREEIETLRTGLTESRDELQELMGERDEAAGTAADRDHLQQDYEALQRKFAKLKLGEQDYIVQVCDFRTRVNRLEKECDDAARERKHKVKKVLRKVHHALDDAGAPGEPNVSFGERIRWLKQRIDELSSSGSDGE